MSNQQTPVVFTGKAGEYFGIWIVNLLLSILTLGIYSAWAKVRRMKYFYNNTLIDGVGFDYHANPIAILKGRIIAVVLFVIFQVLTGFSPLITGIMFILFLIALPWIVTRGLMFNARNSSHRGLRFDFDGTYGQAAFLFVIYPILMLLTLGLAYPFMMQRFNKFMFDHHKFGTSHFDMQASVKSFYRVYLIFVIFYIIAILGMIAAIAIPAYQGYKARAISMHEPAHIQQVAQHAHANSNGFIKVANTSDRQDVAIEGNAAEAFDQEAFLNSLSAEERAEFEAMMQSPTPEAPPARKMPTVKEAIGIFLAGILYLVFILAITAYIKSRTANLVWNNTSLAHVSFISNQRARDLMWLYFSNTVVLILTVGLATPWAQIRMARYRAEHLALAGEADWDKFVGEKKEQARAMGEEIADMFDVDLSFG